MNFKLPHALKAQITDHAMTTPAVEVCGLLASKGATVCSVYPIPNIAEQPATSFYMEPHAQIAALKAMRQHGEALCAIYHSHPNSEAWPSDRDLQLAAYPGTAYLIVSLLKKEPEINAFMFNGKRFSPITLEII